MIVFDWFIGPFSEFAFMRRALAGCIALSVSACPVGVFLMLRRMSLTGDAMAHAILPGAAIGFLIAGLELVPMTVGGLLAGLAVAWLSGMVSRATIQKEDASLAAFYLISLALGVLLVSVRGSNVDLMHVLFGSALALDNQSLAVIGSIAAVTLVALAVVWRGLFAECLDPVFLRSVSSAGPAIHLIFLGLVVLNLVGGFAALGTLLAVGIMILPAASARFWTSRLETMCLLAVGFGITSSVAGLLLSFHANLPAGPAVILTAGAAYVLSMALGPRGVRGGRTPRRHRTA